MCIRIGDDREGAQKAGPKLLEPIMKVEVVSPEDYVGGVSATSPAGGANILGQEMRGTQRSSTPWCRLQICSAT